MARRISPWADIHPAADIADDVEVGPFCRIGPDVRLGAGCKLDSHVVLDGHTTIGCHNRFFPFSVIGADPQDYSYLGSPTRVEIGDHNIFREGVTVNRGAEKEDGVTRIGNHNMFMANTHVAHNCHIHNHAMLINGALLGGHVHMHDGAIVSGNSCVHHFATLGTLSFVGGSSRVTMDIPPYMLASGSDDPKIVTVNLVGLRRKGISEESISVLKRAHRLLYREHKGVTETRDILQNELAGQFPAELVTLLEFLENTKAGVKGRSGELRRHAPVTAPTSGPVTAVVHKLDLATPAVAEDDSQEQRRAA